MKSFTGLQVLPINKTSLNKCLVQKNKKICLKQRKNQNCSTRCEQLMKCFEYTCGQLQKQMKQKCDIGGQISNQIYHDIVSIF